MTQPEIKEGEYHIVRDSRPTSYPYDVMRRIRGRDFRINSFQTEIHARYFAAAQTISTSSPPSGGEAVSGSSKLLAEREK